jgi:hypothetical protein
MTLVPLSDKEEAILDLLIENTKLKDEVEKLKEELRQIYWSLEEKD